MPSRGFKSIFVQDPVLPQQAASKAYVDRVKSLGDIAFLSKKSFQGKIVSKEGFLTVTGDLATLTASGGKDMYLARAQITWFSNTTNPSAVADECVLRINGTIIETSKSSLDGDSMQGLVYEFKNIGHKVLTTEIIKLEVITLDTETDIEGFIECYEEDTGADPTA